jgi:hypothetical protein
MRRRSSSRVRSAPANFFLASQSAFHSLPEQVIQLLDPALPTPRVEIVNAPCQKPTGHSARLALKSQVGMLVGRLGFAVVALVLVIARTPTADLRGVNCVVRKLNPFACLAFPVLTMPRMPLNDRVLVTNW